ncbi:type I phosphomannose isomerase catalytic subunit [Clostridium cylindrosporum]|uniref:Phosphohexomutase n=1 Tax=Clostridium cylindrosporum DSM 605 TaxID=1121307 RepID=A0A0J8DER1_CLOCY|nr:type I phosphomannose isomerase catalytic subunit [Clostridium cylindrosporum]KMT22673.1 putative mannose-6-phosphate isomerase GmuF [Clostridium cylindrosporum DSM 605]
MFYPLFLTPFFKECVWGGDNLRQKLNKDYSGSKIGESFEVSCHKDFLCKIKNGIFKDIYLKTLVDIYPVEILGKNINSDFFPLIIKFLDASSRLSVQVHPNDFYAMKKSYSLGKNELWYVVYANENSKIVLGLKDNVTKADIKNSIEKNNIESLLNIENISVGDAIFIPSGTVHALLEDTIVLEVQQSSDITYRLYDWDRNENGKRRELHIDDALNVIDISSRGKIIRSSEYIDEDFYNLLDIKDFTVDYLKIKNSLISSPDLRSFHIYTCVDGNGRIIYKNQSQSISRGNSILIPASLGEYEIRGNLEVIKIYVK